MTHPVSPGTSPEKSQTEAPGTSRLRDPDRARTLEIERLSREQARTGAAVRGDHHDDESVA